MGSSLGFASLLCLRIPAGTSLNSPGLLLLASLSPDSGCVEAGTTCTLAGFFLGLPLERLTGASTLLLGISAEAALCADDRS